MAEEESRGPALELAKGVQSALRVVPAPARLHPPDISVAACRGFVSGAQSRRFAPLRNPHP